MTDQEQGESVARAAMDAVLKSQMSADTRFILKHFKFEHLEGGQRAIAVSFTVLACQLVHEGRNAIDIQHALWKLLAACDAAVRACEVPA